MKKKTTEGNKDPGNSRYRTKDLYLAALIYAKDEQFIGLEAEDRYYLFIFQDKEKCEEIADSYWQGRCTVNAKAYMDAIRTLKDLIFSRG